MRAKSYCFSNERVVCLNISAELGATKKNSEIEHHYITVAYYTRIIHYNTRIFEKKETKCKQANIICNL